MTRTLTLKEYIVEELNRRARERGDDFEIVLERPKPQLVHDNIIQLQSKEGANGNGNAK